jgi:hypothetical protein
MDLLVWLFEDVVIFQVWGYVPPLIWAWGVQWYIQNLKIILFKEGWLMDLLVWLFGDVIIFQVWSYVPPLIWAWGFQRCVQNSKIMLF